MPAWKKIIISGSDAALNSLFISDGLIVSGSTNLHGNDNGSLYIDSELEPITTFNGNQSVGFTYLINNYSDNIDFDVYYSGESGSYHTELSPVYQHINSGLGPFDGITIVTNNGITLSSGSVSSYTLWINVKTTPETWWSKSGFTLAQIQSGVNITLTGNTATNLGISNGDLRNAEFISGSNPIPYPNTFRYTIPNPISFIGDTRITGSLYVSNGIYGNLTGTASLSVASASFASTASFINVTGSNAFIQGGNSFGTGAILGTNDNQSLVLRTSGSARVTLNAGGGVSFNSNALSSMGAGWSISSNVFGMPGNTNGFIALSGDRTLNFTNGATNVGIMTMDGNTQNTLIGNSLTNAVTAARLVVRGAGSTGATNTLRIENSAQTASLIIRNDNSGSYAGNFNLAGNLTITGSGTNSLSVRGTGITSASNAMFISNANTTFQNLAYLSFREDGRLTIKHTYATNGPGSGSFAILDTNGTTEVFSVGHVGSTFTRVQLGIGSMGWATTGLNATTSRNGYNMGVNFASDYSGSVIPFNYPGFIPFQLSNTSGLANTWNWLGFSANGRNDSALLTAAIGVQYTNPTRLSFLVGNNGVNFVERMTILSNGNVGIGDRFPSSSLSVAGTTRLSGSFNTAASGSILTVIGSGSAQPIFTVQGSQGELFSVTDSLSGSLFSVNNISGLPILETFSDDTVLIGSYLAPALNTTVRSTLTNSGSFTVYSIPTASYDGAFFEYVAKSGSNARAGNIMATYIGTTASFTETTTTDIGSTTGLNFTVFVTGSNLVLTGSVTTPTWTIKTIVRSI